MSSSLIWRTKFVAMIIIVFAALILYLEKDGQASLVVSAVNKKEGKKKKIKK